MKIAGYCRISVDLEQDRDNTSIENQKSIIQDFVSKKFPDADLTFYADRDRSGYTFEQREEYQKLRAEMLKGEYDILVVKDFSRFSRRNSKGLVELEDLRDVGMRIISINDSIDYPTYDDWTAIQFRFLINEMPVTDTSKKILAVVQRRQEEGKWICSVPYGYYMTNTKKMTFEIDEAEAQVVRLVFEKYIDGWGYKKIANYLTEQHIPTPRMVEKQRKEEKGEENKIIARAEWSIITVQKMLINDFYVGTLRQHKYKRTKINGVDKKVDESDNIVFENHHEPIVDNRTFSLVQEMMKLRTRSNYRGVKKYRTDYSGYLFCGDCGSPMFSLSRPNKAPAYICGTYHKRSLKGCTMHYTRVDVLDSILKEYIKRVKENSADVIDRLQNSIDNGQTTAVTQKSIIETLENQIETAKSEMKLLIRQQASDLDAHPDRTEIISETYSEMIEELTSRIEGLKNQRNLAIEKDNLIAETTRSAKTVLEIFDNILSKPQLDKTDISLIVDKIIVYNDHLDIKLKADIDCLLNKGADITAVNFNNGIKTNCSAFRKVTYAESPKRGRKLDVNIINDGSPSLIRIVRRISLGITILPKSSILRTIPVAFIYQFLQNIINQDSNFCKAVCWAVKSAVGIVCYFVKNIHSFDKFCGSQKSNH